MTIIIHLTDPGLNVEFNLMNLNYAMDKSISECRSVEFQRSLELGLNYFSMA